MKIKLGLFFLVFILFDLSSSYSQLSTQALAGGMYIDGDVEHVFDPLNSFQVAVGKDIGSKFELELRFGTGRPVGINSRSSQIGSEGGYLVEDVYRELGVSKWHVNYISNYSHIGLGANFQSEIGLNRLSFFAGFGIGISISQTNVNLKSIDQFGTVRYYEVAFDDQNPDLAIKSIKNFYDDLYETKIEEGNSINPYLGLQFGLQLEIKNGLFIVANVRRHVSFTDYLDPIAYASPTETSGNNDHVNMFSVGFKGYLIRGEEERLPDE